MTPEVTMRPGYRVPPVTRPRGCHVPERHRLLAFDINQAFIDRMGLRTIIEPIPEGVEAIVHEIFRCPKVEPRID